MTFRCPPLFLVSVVIAFASGTTRASSSSSMAERPDSVLERLEVECDRSLRHLTKPTDSFEPLGDDAAGISFGDVRSVTLGHADPSLEARVGAAVPSIPDSL